MARISFVKKFIFALLKVIMFFVLAGVLTVDGSNGAILLDSVVQPLAWIAGLVCGVNMVWKCLDSGTDWKMFLGFVALMLLGNFASAMANFVIVLVGVIVAFEGFHEFPYAGGYFAGAFSGGTKYNKVIAFCKFTYPIAIILVGASLVCYVFSYFPIFTYAQIACYVTAVAHILECVMLVCLKREGYID